MGKEYITLPAEMATRLIEVSNAWNVKNKTLNTMASVGVDLTTPSGLDYIESVVAAAAEYDQLIYEMAQYAAKNSEYNPETDSLSFAAKRGVAWWTSAETEKPVMGFSGDSATEPPKSAEEG